MPSLRTIALQLLFLGSICAWASAGPSARQSSQPNVVILIADDLGYGDIGCFGAPLIATPRIDGMAAQGAKLTSFYVQPSCSPTRAALLTGSHPQRVGVPRPIAQWGETGLSGAETTIAEVMGAAGYATGYFGKWHLGDSPDQLPSAQGFDDVLANPWGHLADPSAYVDSNAAEWEWEPDERFDTQRFTERAVDFIQAAASSQTPFLCVVSYHAPHFPAAASPAFEGVSADGREYGDSVEEIDSSVGTLLDVIDASGVGPDTLVVFLSDNGPALSQGPYQAGSTGGLRGAKATTFEGGMRVPFVARWTGTIAPGSQIDEIASELDFMPMLAGLSGGQLPHVTLDGVDMLPILTGGPGDPDREIFYVYGGVVRGVRVGRFKLHDGELYDLASDPGEQTDLAAAEPATTLDLTARINAYALDLAADTRPAGVQARLIADWRADSGLSPGTLLSDGDEWRSTTQPTNRWIVEDSDPTADLELASRVGPAPTNVPGVVLRQSSANANVPLTSSSVTLTEGGPFTVAMWTRSIEPDPQTPIVLLDVGDANAGLCITVGDGGVMGDDLAPGRADDLRLRVGGQLSLASAALTCDL
ncbi:MAG: sulfatase-like hydrolase/transferase, partial [Planctomycetota bacterium]